MRNLLLLIALIFSSCAERDMPTPQSKPELEGKYKRLVTITPDWVYTFQGGFFTQTLFGSGTPIEYPYATKSDSIFIGGDMNTPARIWKTAFIGDSVLEVLAITPGVIFQERFWLRKLPD